MNLTNWPALNVWVFIAQLIEHCSANAEAMSSNPIEATKTFFGLNCDCTNRKHNCDDHTFFFSVNIKQMLRSAKINNSYLQACPPVNN